MNLFVNTIKNIVGAGWQWVAGEPAPYVQATVCRYSYVFENVIKHIYHDKWTSYSRELMIVLDFLKQYPKGSPEFEQFKNGLSKPYQKYLDEIVLPLNLDFASYPNLAEMISKTNMTKTDLDSLNRRSVVDWTCEYIRAHNESEMKSAVERFTAVNELDNTQATQQALDNQILITQKKHRKELRRFNWITGSLIAFVIIGIKFFITAIMSNPNVTAPGIGSIIFILMIFGATGMLRLQSKHQRMAYCVWKERSSAFGRQDAMSGLPLDVQQKIVAIYKANPQLALDIWTYMWATKDWKGEWIPELDCQKNQQIAVQAAILENTLDTQTLDPEIKAILETIPMEKTIPVVDRSH